MRCLRGPGGMASPRQHHSRHDYSVQPPRLAFVSRCRRQVRQWHDAFRALPQASTPAATSTEDGGARANLAIDKQSEGSAADIEVIIAATHTTTGQAKIATTTASHSHVTLDSTRTTASAASHSRCTSDPTRTTAAAASHSRGTIDST
jgi:hypothetical protein